MYREFQPDYLVAVDIKMVNEINMTRYQNEHQVWTNYNKSFEQYTGFNYFEPSLGWSSGPTAMHLAASHAHETIYILGFDYKGIGPKELITYTQVHKIIKDQRTVQRILAIGYVKRAM